MAQTGWNKVIESTGNVYYHNKHTGQMQFAPPPSVPDNVPLKRALKMQSYEKVRDNHGCATRAYPVGKDVYVSASQFESIKYVHVGVYTKISHRATPRATGDGVAIDEGVWNERQRSSANRRSVTPRKVTFASRKTDLRYFDLGKRSVCEHTDF